MADFELLRQRASTLLTGKGTGACGEDVRRKRAELEAEAQGLLCSLQSPEGSGFLWEDCSGRANYLLLTFRRLKLIATAARTQGTKFYKDSGIAAEVLSAADFLCRTGYNESVDGTKSWWMYEAAIPRDLMDIAILLRDDMTREQRDMYVGAVSHFNPDPVYIKGCKLSSGANRVWKCIATVKQGITEESVNTVMRGRAALDDIFRYSESGDGFYRDGSFIQHEIHPYNGGYGCALLENIVCLMSILAGTEFAVSAEEAEYVYSRVHDSFEPLVYRGAMMSLVKGREITRPAGEFSAGATALQSALLLAEQAEDADERHRLYGIAREWYSGIEEKNYRYMSVRGVELMEELLCKRSGSAGGASVYFKGYPCMDRAVCRGDGFALGIAMSSDRTAKYEGILGENRRGWHTAEGALYLYNADVGQFADIFWVTADYSRLAGVTASKRGLSDNDGTEYLQSRGQCGCVNAGGGCGAAAMLLESFDKALTAKKSWFFFENKLAALGAGISEATGAGAETTIENRMLDNMPEPAAVIGGTEVEHGGETVVCGALWAQLKSSVRGMQIGYCFLEPVTVRAICETR